MTNDEALEIIKLAISEVEWDYPLDYAIAFEKAISALEKQIPKKRADGWYGDNTECPICHIVASGNYCAYCGQKIDWEDEV